MISPFERRTFLQALAVSLAPPALVSSTSALAAEDPSRAATSVPTEGKTMQNELTHRTLTLNGIQFHIAEQGQGPLVLLCHEWPECW
jgi:hypothetical protein